MNRDGQLNVMAAVVSRFLMMLRANGLIRCMPSANSLIENMLGAKYMIGNVARANTLISIQTWGQLFILIVPINAFQCYCVLRYPRLFLCQWMLCAGTAPPSILPPLPLFSFRNATIWQVGVLSEMDFINYLCQCER